MTAGALCGHLLSPLPGGEWDARRDAVVAWDDFGRLLPADAELSTAPRTEFSEQLLLPGFVDAHIHLPQIRVRGRFQDALLPWLRKHIWPEEERFAERDYREAVTREFRDGLLAVGTTAAMVYGSPEADSAHAVLRDLAPLCIHGGDVLMDRNGPAALLRPAEEALSDCAAHIAHFGSDYVLTPRFAPTCGPELMAGCGLLVAKHGARVQTHLAENRDEVEWVADLFPERRSYTEVYEHFGLLGAGAVLGHCIYLDDDDIEAVLRSGSWVAHCPTSNVALSSGRMPLERFQAAGIPFALATDVGAGPDLSMMDVMRVFLEVHRGAVELSPLDALRAATLSGAEAIGEGKRRGAVCAGRQADLVALHIPGGLRRGEELGAAFERSLHAFEGRYEEAVAGVWIAGQQVTA